MRRRNAAAALAVSTVLALSAGILTVPASAEPGQADDTTTTPDETVVPTPGPGERPEIPALAAGVIVKAKEGADLVTMRSAVARASGAQVARTVAVGGGARAFVSQGTMPLAEARELASQIAERPDVEWAEPNVVVQPTATTWPFPVNDPMAGELANLWDTRDLPVAPWPAGGYGTKAPALWNATTGQGVTVAVLDTGIRSEHPDLAGQVIGGYDLIADPLRANDGDGRDADPSDPGDWSNPSECDADFPYAIPSTWHGTHVAGTIAATSNNATGVVGMAPGARLLDVRVLGRCGGTLADVAAGIRWAAGVPVSGVPTNPSPAKILNMSLGAPGYCSTVYQSAVDDARARGASIFVALGNDSQPGSNHAPANCNGVIAVHSHTTRGDRARYSNYGTTADVSAPGGDLKVDVDRGVLSTIDVGQTTPAGPGYVRYEGTSMATPAAAGVGALIYALGEGRFTPDGLEAAVRAAVSPFPTSGVVNPCTTSLCGTGAVDATTLPAPMTAPVVVGTPKAGSTLTVTDAGAWGGAPAARTISWYVNGRVAGSGTTFVVPRSGSTSTIVAVSHVAGGAFAPIGKASAPVVVPGSVVKKKRSRLVIKGKKTVRKGKKFRVTVRIKVRGIGRPTGRLKIFINGRRAFKGRVSKRHRGRVRLTGVLVKRGKNRLKFVYSGNKRIKGSRKKVTYRVV